MTLFVALRGEAEEELEHCDLSRVDDAGGVDYIVETLRQPLMVKGIYLKRKYLDEFERLQRRPGEGVKSFCNRHHRVERSLSTVGVNTSAMYDDEAAGSRLLDRLRLGLEAQRMILVATGQSLNYQRIKDAAELQFPEHRPTPPVVYTRDFENAKDDKQDRPKNDYKPTGYRYDNGGKGKGGKGGKSKYHHNQSAFTKKTYIAETIEDTIPEDENGEIEAEQAGDDTAGDAEPPEDDPQEAEADDLEEDVEDIMSGLHEAAECLTVTARRLQGLTLGRKFSGDKSLAQRKAESHCAVCGARGHWKGDPECPQSSEQKSKNDKGGKPSQAGKPFAKKVLTVNHHDGAKRSVNFEETSNEAPGNSYGTYFTYMITSPIPEGNLVFSNNTPQYVNYMVMDTACQKSCCSTLWLEHQMKSLKNHNLRVRTFPSREPFEFGHGPTQYSDVHVHLPVCFDNNLTNMVLLGASVLSATNNIPFLASNELMGKKLKMILNLPHQKAVMEALGIEVPICLVGGHLAIGITEFPPDAHQSCLWKQFTDMFDAGLADRDFVCAPADGPVKSKDSTKAPSALADASHAALMAAQLAKAGEAAAGCGDASGDSAHPRDPPGDSTKIMAGLPGPHGDELHDHLDGEGNGPLHSRQHPTQRQQARQLREAQPLRQEMAMVRKSPKMDRSSTTKIAAAAIALINGLHLPGQATPSSMESDTWNLQGQQGIRQGHQGRPSRAEQYEDGMGETIDYINDFVGSLTVQGEQFRHSPKEQSQAQGDRAGADRFLGLRLGTNKPLKAGHITWLTGYMRNIAKTYIQENAAYTTLKSYAEKMRHGPKIDLLEIFAGSANLSSRAVLHGLSSLEPIDKEINVDLSNAEGRNFVWNVIYKFRPLLVHIAWPCTSWSVFNENLNYAWRPEEFHQLRQEDIVLVDFGCDVMHYQNDHDRLYLGENPKKSRIWSTPSVQSVLDLPENLVTDCDAGAYGAENLDNQPIIKTHQWTTNSKHIAKELQKKMTPEQKMYAAPISGRHTTEAYIMKYKFVNLNGS